MSCIFVLVVFWMLYALINQASPMAVETGQEGQTESASAPEAIPNKPQDHPLYKESQTISASAPVNVHVTIPSQPVPVPSAQQTEQKPCPPNSQAVPCPQECPSLENNQPSTKKETGWWNGFKKAAYLCWNTIRETLVGEEGYLTNLPDKIVCGAPPPPKKIKKKDSNEAKSTPKGNGNVKACCIFYKNGPPVKDDNEEEDTTDEKTLQAPPVSCYYFRNTSNMSGVPAAAAAAAAVPIVPGAKTKHQDTQVNCCCVGKRLFNLKSLFKWIFKPQFNCCAVTINANAVEVN